MEATFTDQALRGSIVYFDNSYTDQVALHGRVYRRRAAEYVNIDGSQAHGWELEVALQRPVRGFTASANYALVDTEVVTNISTSQQFQPGQPLLRRPKHSGALRAAYAYGRATVNFNMRIVGERHDNSFLFMDTIPNSERPSSFTTDITVNPGYVVAGLGLDFRVAGAADRVPARRQHRRYRVRERARLPRASPCGRDWRTVQPGHPALTDIVAPTDRVLSDPVYSSASQAAHSMLT